MEILYVLSTLLLMSHSYFLKREYLRLPLPPPGKDLSIRKEQMTLLKSHH